MPQLVITASNAGTYTAFSFDGSSGSITFSINGGAYATFVNPTILVAGNTIDVDRVVGTTAGYYELTGTY